MIVFKTDRQKTEFADPNIDSRVRVILFAVSGYAEHTYQRDVEITEVFRTQEEQNDIYTVKALPEIAEQYKVHPWYSVHQFWRGVDFVMRGAHIEEVEAMEKWVNGNFVYTHLSVKTALEHNMGAGLHIHIQVDNDNVTEIKKVNISTNDTVGEI